MVQLLTWKCQAIKGGEESRISGIEEAFMQRIKEQPTIKIKLRHYLYLGNTF